MANSGIILGTRKSTQYFLLGGAFRLRALEDEKNKASVSTFRWVWINRVSQDDAPSRRLVLDAAVKNETFPLIRFEQRLGEDGAGDEVPS